MTNCSFDLKEGETGVLRRSRAAFPSTRDLTHSPKYLHNVVLIQSDSKFYWVIKLFSFISPCRKTDHIRTMFIKFKFFSFLLNLKLVNLKHMI